jgi:hypothetical protein
LLKHVNSIMKDDVVRFAPFRLFLRVVTASVFLLKALAAGTRLGDLQPTVDVLKQTVRDLEKSAIDDIHWAHNFAILLDSHIKRLEQKFFQASRPLTTDHSVAEAQPEAQTQSASASHTLPLSSIHYERGTPNSADDPLQGELFQTTFGIGSEEQWLSIPLDQMIGPLFPTGDYQHLPDLQDSDQWDYLWSMPI